MKNVLLFCIVLLSIAMTPPKEQIGEVTLIIKNIKADHGKIWIGLYDSKENFLVQENSVVHYIPINGQNQVEWKITNLKYGDYAIGLFHDENGNDHMDQNFVGIPTEAYGFSGKLQSIWRLPYFEEVKFNVNQPFDTVEVQLQTWGW